MGWVAMASHSCLPLASPSCVCALSHIHTSVSNPFIKVHLVELSWVNWFPSGTLNGPSPTQPGEVGIIITKIFSQVRKLRHKEVKYLVKVTPPVNSRARIQAQEF